VFCKKTKNNRKPLRPDIVSLIKNEFWKLHTCKSEKFKILVFQLIHHPKKQVAEIFLPSVILTLSNPLSPLLVGLYRQLVTGW
jgi:hypothetical protein